MVANKKVKIHDPNQKNEYILKFKYNRVMHFKKLKTMQYCIIYHRVTL